MEQVVSIHRKRITSSTIPDELPFHFISFLHPQLFLQLLKLLFLLLFHFPLQFRFFLLPPLLSFLTRLHFLLLRLLHPRSIISTYFFRFISPHSGPSNTQYKDADRNQQHFYVAARGLIPAARPKKKAKPENAAHTGNQAQQEKPRRPADIATALNRGNDRKNDPDTSHQKCCPLRITTNPSRRQNIRRYGGHGPRHSLPKQPCYEKQQRSHKNVRCPIGHPVHASGRRQSETIQKSRGFDSFCRRCAIRSAPPVGRRRVGFVPVRPIILLFFQFYFLWCSRRFTLVRRGRKKQGGLGAINRAARRYGRRHRGRLRRLLENGLGLGLGFR